MENSEIYRLLNQISSDSSHMRGRLDEALPEIKNAIANHDKRINTLEGKESYRSGAAAIISLVVSVAFSVLPNFFKNK